MQQPLLHNPQDPFTAKMTAMTGLSPLTPTSLMPERYSRHMQLLTKLKQIRRLQVSRVASSPVNGTKRSYVIDVYTASQSMTRIPTSLKNDDALAVSKGLYRQPDVHIEKTFADFVKLRDDLYECCQSSHAFLNCAFCNEVARYLLLGAVLPGALLTWMLPQQQRTKAVHRFVEALLLLAVSCPVIEANACPCQEKLPRHLYKFLFEASDPTA